MTTQTALTPVGVPTLVMEWDTLPCQPCRRKRVHWRGRDGKFRCIGTLPGRRYAAKCGEPT